MMMRPSKDRPSLSALIRQAVDTVAALSPAEREALFAAQRRSWMRGELAMGSDADEARWRAAGPEERARIDAELQARADRSVPRGTDEIHQYDWPKIFRDMEIRKALFGEGAFG